MLGNITFTLLVQFLVLLLSLSGPFFNFENKYCTGIQNLATSSVCLSLTNLTRNTLPYLSLQSDRQYPQLATHQFSMPQITINLTYALKHGIQKYLTVTTHNQQFAVPTSHLYIMN